MSHCFTVLVLCGFATASVFGARTPSKLAEEWPGFIIPLTWELDLRDECGPDVGNARALSYQEEKDEVLGSVFYVQAEIPFFGNKKTIQRELAIILRTSPPSLINSPCDKINTTRTKAKSVGNDTSYTGVLNFPRYNLKKDCGADLEDIIATAYQDEYDAFGNHIIHIFATFIYPKGQHPGGQVAVNMTGDPMSFIAQKPCAKGAWKGYTKHFDPKQLPTRFQS